MLLIVAALLCCMSWNSIHDIVTSRHRGGSFDNIMRSSVSLGLILVVPSLFIGFIAWRLRSGERAYAARMRKAAEHLGSDFFECVHPRMFRA